ncbi:MAG: carbohydrate kinase family protein, partial [Patescibacteria group bacterium]
MTTTLIVLDGHMMDYMVEGADDLLLQSLNIDPSSEYLMVDAVEWERLADLCRHRGLLPTMMVGGAGANTARWFGRLGGQVQVYGQVGQDENGRTHLAQLSRDLCDVRVRQVAQPTGRSLVLVRPNGGRVMRSDIGGGMYFDDEATVKAGIQPNTWLHLTGYLLNQAFPIHRVAFAAMETATDLHVPISIDLGSGAYLGREIMRQVIERYNAT